MSNISANYFSAVQSSAQTLDFDTHGKLRLMLPYGMPGDKIASDLKILLNS